MDEGLISRRYAKALLKYAQDQGCADRIYDESKNFEKAFTQHPEVEKALQNPVLKREEKERLIVSATGGNAATAFIRFIRLVIGNRRESETISPGIRHSSGKDHHGNKVKR